MLRWSLLFGLVLSVQSQYAMRSNSASTPLVWLRSSIPAANRFTGFPTGGTCQKTQPDVFGAGPFENGYGDTAGNAPVPYPIRFNLLVSPSAQSSPIDEQLLVYGIVRDTNCIPLAGYRVQIWSASRNAIYSSSAQQSYRGAAITDAEGKFSFQTVFPAPYSNRPSHLHVEVWRPGTQTPAEGIITTQYYFAGDRFLSFDSGSSQAEPSRILNWSERSPEGRVIVRPIITV